MQQQVFIGGCDRSGTTFSGSLLGGHSSCLCTPESQFKTDVLRRGLEDGDKQLEYIIKHWRFKIWGVKLKNSQALNYDEVINDIVSEYASLVDKKNFNIWVDHTPNNIQNLCLLNQKFPNSKFIHIIRDGRAVAASVIPLDWGPNTIEEAAHFWNEKVSFGLAAEKFFGSDKLLTVHYENIVANPEKVLKKICNFLNIDFQYNMLSGNGFKLPSYTNTQHRLIGSKPSTKRINSWEQNLSKDEIAMFENISKDLLSYLGYRQKKYYYIPSRKDRLFSYCKKVSRSFLNRYRRKKRINNSLKGAESHSENNN
ncbi:Sulfotransferase family protein [Lentibacillus halodurans]|uniref:Sulfotransferase family protein n=1 Tax=Lentibacillus halodurans TaxID=237679 RepID=A0A1I0XKZ9_9BACI|nr:sulfotransferase [Lentibacillus halodurans]SFB01086.1 Sulfotransferase family protein [Lentibacillus halodurans]